jgi:hypothetical protein
VDSLLIVTKTTAEADNKFLEEALKLLREKTFGALESVKKDATKA